MYCMHSTYINTTGKSSTHTYIWYFLRWSKERIHGPGRRVDLELVVQLFSYEELPSRSLAHVVEASGLRMHSTRSSAEALERALGSSKPCKDRRHANRRQTNLTHYLFIPTPKLQRKQTVIEMCRLKAYNTYYLLYIININAPKILITV